MEGSTTNPFLWLQRGGDGDWGGDGDRGGERQLGGSGALGEARKEVTHLRLERRSWMLWRRWSLGGGYYGGWIAAGDLEGYYGL